MLPNHLPNRLPTIREATRRSPGSSPPEAPTCHPGGFIPPTSIGHCRHAWSGASMLANSIRVGTERSSRPLAERHRAGHAVVEGPDVACVQTLMVCSGLWLHATLWFCSETMAGRDWARAETRESPRTERESKTPQTEHKPTRPRVSRQLNRHGCVMAAISSVWRGGPPVPYPPIEKKTL